MDRASLWRAIDEKNKAWLHSLLIAFVESLSFVEQLVIVANRMYVHVHTSDMVLYLPVD